MVVTVPMGGCRAMDKDAKVGSGPQISLLVEFEEISNVGLLALGRIVVYKRGVAVFLG